ncbi:hypothetical protein U9M48_010480 [Paspalum notatum var. saurae]|uniref:Uncharacterized protein n=1 Tax=Paspalum notatum var. saurae TaxID=547442 RepID=A0AAQ3WGJ5_PASNO
MATIKLALPVALLLCGLSITSPKVHQALSLLVLLLQHEWCHFLNYAGLMVLGSIPSTGAKEGKMCPMYCLEANYTTCPSTGTQHLKPACNCCMANEKGCTIYLTNGGVQKCP